MKNMMCLVCKIKKSATTCIKHYQSTVVSAVGADETVQ